MTTQTRHRPTDRELDIACAEVLGHKVYCDERDTEKRFPYYIPSGKPRRTHMIDAMLLPHYSTDRNALPELWEAVEKAQRRHLYIDCLIQLLGDKSLRYCQWEQDYLLNTAPCRQIVIAALKALGQWRKEEWSEEE